MSCRICTAIGNEPDKPNTRLADDLGTSEASIRRHRKARHNLQDVDEFFTDVPVGNISSRGRSIRTESGWEKVTYKYDTHVPEWQPVDRPPLTLRTPTAQPKTDGRKWRIALAGADTQIGFRNLDDGLDPFHDDKALALFNTLAELINPDKVLLCGDIIDLPSQSRWAQEAAFANTTQAALDRTHEWLADLRARAPHAEIDLIEGNHDKRLQNFVETNAVSAFGLKRSNYPDEWPVMSIPYLLRLDELDITYHDAYPAAHVWVNNVLRAEHGTKANSKGSTAAQYLNDTPHFSRVIGHVHRQEQVSKTTFDRMGRIKSTVINPGCLCRTDGAVPSVNGAIGANGNAATNYENWQQGAAVIYFTDDEFYVTLVQFEDGKMMWEGKEYEVPGEAV